LRDRGVDGILAAVKRAAMPPIPQVNANDSRRALACAPPLLEQHLQRLRELPAHGNTTLHADQLVKGLLLSFFEPMTRSLRLIEARGDFAGRMDLSRLARSTTSDALAAFDPAHLLPLIEDLRARCPNLDRADANLAGVTRRIIAADGTYMTTLADVVWALQHTKKDGRRQGQVRLNVQLDVANWVPQVVSLSGDDNESEPAAVAKDLLSGVLYVVDRNFLDFKSFIAPALAKGNDLILRIRANAPAVRVIKSLALTAADAEAGVVADELVELSGRGARDVGELSRAAGTFRLVTTLTTDRNGKAQTIRLLTNLIDAKIVAAHVIGAAYRLRWQIELFFKWLKCFARINHLLSTSRNGITTQIYVAMIAVLLMYVQTGRRLSIYALAALSNVANGQLTMQQAMEVIASRERERDLARARQQRRRRAKKLA
jgi:hypothetical protein